MNFRQHLLEGQVIPAHPLALDASRRLDERHQRALTRYYIAAGAGGIAVGVHTTQAVAEAEIAVALGYLAGLLGLGAWAGASDEAILEHCRTVADIIPVFGFYLQPAVGGRVLGYAFWRELADIPNVVAIKIAPFNRYRTLDVVRAVADAERDDIALYTGNDDAIVADLLTPIPCIVGGRVVERRIVGGLLGQWAVWTRSAVQMLEAVKAARVSNTIDAEWLRTGAMLTDANGAFFDARHDFAGSIAGIHEVLRRQGLLRGVWCLDPGERLSPGQEDEIDRVLRSYPSLSDDAFVAAHREEWLTP